MSSMMRQSTTKIAGRWCRSKSNPVPPSSYNLATSSMKRNMIAQIPQQRMYTCHSQLADEHRLIYEMCRKFADDELAPNAGKWDKEHSFPTDAVSKLAELGLMGINTKADYNGSELDAMSYAIAMEEISRGCASVGVIMSAHNSLYLYPLQTYGSEELNEQWVAPYAQCAQDGDNKLLVGCFGLSEPGNGSDAGAASTTAVLDGDEWIVNGTKAWITNAHEASAAVVFATTDKSLKYVCRFYCCILLESIFWREI
jgi:butyryl-CoA dehydrogenase